MRNLFLSLVLILGLSVAPVSYVCPQEAPAPATTEVVEAGSATVAATTDDATLAEEEEKVEAEEKANPWVALAWKVAAIILGALSVVVILAAKLGFKKIEKKLGIEIPDAIEAIAEGYLVKAINWTEAWAKKKSDAPTADDKMAETIRVAVEKAGESEYVRKFIEEKGKDVVEKLLKSDDTPEDATPKS